VNFRVPVDNAAHTPFVPRLAEKPHSIKPLAILPEYGDDGNIESYLHPYECELDKFEPPKAQLQRAEPQPPKPLAETELVYISELAELQKLLTDLEPYDELAVDLEHHSYRTYQGITCLMQISTRDKDYIIDTLALREDLHILNLVLANPKKLKVFHGADSDIEWLQRDLSLYVVNMFDTHRAARKLEFARYSLAFLLKHYCQIEADKTFQLADWRIRPLPQKLIDYARQDTHYLLYVYDRLRNELIDRSAGKSHVVRSVYTESTLLCKKKYVKPVVTDTSHMVLYYKSKRSFDNRQLHALKELYLWRDKIARQEDESTGYVLPQHMLLQIAESLPREMQGILACCNPIPPLVRQHLQVRHRKPVLPFTRGARHGKICVENFITKKSDALVGRV
jgi:exosome complex exonuclease RRP6